LFWCVYFIELRYNTRNITKITGLWYSDSRLGKILFLNLISFIDLPITLMFWGELWLWVTLVVNYPLLSIQLYLLGGITFIVFFFKIWWGVMLGVSGASILKPVDNNFYIYYLVMLYIIGFQVLVGIQPSILKFLII
jgi:NADH:ubiquinone oxidoreductase subunit 4 (subunit M)